MRRQDGGRREGNRSCERRGVEEVLMRRKEKGVKRRADESKLRIPAGKGIRESK